MRVDWHILRRSIADLPRRAQASHAANQRYLTALAAVTVPLGEVAQDICQPIIGDGQRSRAIGPWAKADGALLEAISRGKFAINGLRNRDQLLLSSVDAPERSRANFGCYEATGC